MTGPRRLLVVAGAVFLSLLAASCSTSTPKIAETFWQLNLVHDRGNGNAEERLSFFVHVTDSEGISDLDSIYLLNDQSELYWHLDSSNWQHSDSNGELWVGSNFLQMPNGSAIPRGKYRVLVSNLAGERVSDSIFVSAERLDPTKVEFPTLTEERSTVKITNALADTRLWLYDPKGDFIGSKAISGGSLPLATLLQGKRPPASQLTVYAYGYDKNCGCGLVNGPYELSPEK